MDQKEKRKRVMARSIKIGHCVCDPRKPCPCPLFKAKDICTCAGERETPAADGRKVRLTEFVRSAGCAGKISQKDLHQVLAALPVVEDPRLLVGMATADDAGVFNLASGVTIVQTVDVFTPGVDDPYLFGRIAGCNSLSDVYAMGGKPVTALSVIGFPINSLPAEVMTEIIRGGMDVLKEADCILLGGHSINDEEVKFGFAVTGVVDEKGIVTNAGARAGDVLVLTKPLGTGIVSLATQIGLASEEAMRAAAESMGRLNRKAAEIMVRHSARACTDVTGFGFLGHLYQLAKESRVTAEVWSDCLPMLPGVPEYIEKSVYSGANEKNMEYSEGRVSFASDVGENDKALLFDPQTSGGLLIAFAPDRAEAAVAELHEAGISNAVAVGRITEKSDGRIIVVKGMGRASPCVTPQPPRNCAGGPTRGEGEENMSAKKQSKESCCCSDSSEAVDSIPKFTDFLGSAMSPGAVDVVTKELIAIALGLAVHCVSCTKIHLKKAKEMGISAQELEEAAALAIAFSGCRALMLWNELKKEVPACSGDL